MKCLVLRQTSGPLAGLMRIMGTDEGLGYATPPEFFPQVDLGGYKSDLSLVAVKRSYALYHEVTGPAPIATTFHPSQR